MRKMRELMFRYLGKPEGAFLAIGVSGALVVVTALLGEKFLIGTCLFLGLFVVVMVLSLMSVLCDKYKESEAK